MDLNSSNLRIVFSHGTSFAVNRPPRLESLLDPVVLKFATLCTLLYILFSRNPEGLGGEFWVNASHWAVVLFVGISALGLVFKGIRFLMRRGAISFVYTPFIIVPLVILNEVLGQTIASGLNGGALLPAHDIIANAMQDVCALLLFDILFGTFVAPNHPYFARETVETSACTNAVQPSADSLLQRSISAQAVLTDARVTADVSNGPLTFEPGLTPAPKGELAATAAVIMPLSALPVLTQSQGRFDQVLHINGEDVPHTEILWVRAQDHYVRVYTQRNVHVLRANFTEFLEELPEEAGVQVSRSAWVSFEHVSLVWRTDTMRYRVVLINGEEIQVATSRNIRVVDAMRQRGIPVIQSRNAEHQPAAGTRPEPAEIKFFKAG